MWAKKKYSWKEKPDTLSFFAGTPRKYFKCLVVENNGYVSAMDNEHSIVFWSTSASYPYELKRRMRSGSE